MHERAPQGGTELQLALWQTYVPKELQERVYLSVSAISGPKRPLKPHIFWAHQAHDQPSVQNLCDPLVQQGIDAFVFVSEWQKEHYIRHLQVPSARAHMLRNAIVPIAAHQKPGGPLRLIYTATPFRGLDILLEAFADLPERAAVELHIYSGMALYGRASEDARFAALYERARRMPNVFYHGVVPNREIRQALTQSHIFAYPCTWEETSCMALIEALAAGCVAVVPRLAALPETGSGYAQFYEYTPDHAAHVARFRSELSRAIQQYRATERQAQLAKQVVYIAHAYSWQTRVKEWEEFLTGIIKQYGRSI
jgi:glycosyltransferase involved in cell wall biosynthesis